MKKQNKFLEFLNSRGFYTALFTCLFAVLAIAAFVSIRNIDAISKLTTYGEKDQTELDDYLQPAGIQHDTPISELSTEPEGENIIDSAGGATVRRIIETEKQTEKQQEIKTEKQTAPQSQTDNEPKKTDEKANGSNVKPNASADESEQAKAEKAGTKEEAKPETNEEAKAAPESKPKENTGDNNSTSSSAFTAYEDGDEMNWPLDGAVVMDFSVLHAIYDKTLDQYRTNPTVSISADVGTQVKASTEGVVKSIAIDPRQGYTVVLDHGNGWQTVYGQLQETILVKEGQTVTKGQAIGGVGTPTKYGVLLGPHLVFGVTKDEVPQNPTVVLASGE